MKKLKRLFLILGFSWIVFLNIAAKGADVDDKLAVFNNKTVQLLAIRNREFKSHHEDAKIILKAAKATNSNIDPKANEVVIFVTQRSKQKNVEMSLGKNVKKIIPIAESIKMIQATKTQLRSSDKTTFNKGVQKVINTTASLIDRYYHVKNKNDLSEKELNELNHPQNMKVIWGIGVGIFTIIALAWYQNFKIKH